MINKAVINNTMNELFEFQLKMKNIAVRLWLRHAHKGAVKNGDIRVGFCLNPLFSPGALPHLSYTGSACFLKAAPGSKNRLFNSLPAFNEKEGRRLSFTGLQPDPGSEHFCTLGLGFDPTSEQSRVGFQAACWVRAGGTLTAGRGAQMPSLLYVPRSACQALKTTSGTCGCGVKQTQENRRTLLSPVWGPWWVVHTQHAVFIQHDAQLCSRTQVCTALVACWGFCVVRVCVEWVCMYRVVLPALRVNKYRHVF